MGLGLSLGLTFVFIQGMKNAIGKPRPDLLDRCKPDAANYRKYIVADYAAVAGFNPQWVLVSDAICTTTDDALLNDGFRSFPSGHAGGM
jgi:membrane-associated phospholipid phosphatase